jgi:hypothetical protein
MNKSRFISKYGLLPYLKSFNNLSRRLTTWGHKVQYEAEFKMLNSTTLTEEDRNLIESKLDTVTGWLTREAAYFISYMMNHQDRNNIKGHAVEFGVYHGKLLILLLHHCLKNGSNVIGYDIFKESSIETPSDHAKHIFGSNEKMTLLQRSTKDLSADEVVQLGGGKPRIVSVDGDHTAPGALHDFWLAQNVIDPDGVVLADDVYNTFAIGVSEAFFRYQLSEECGFVPFAQVGNKTMLCSPKRYEFYFNMALQFVDDCSDLEVCRRFVKNRANGENWVVQELMGRPVVLLN